MNQLNGRNSRQEMYAGFFITIWKRVKNHKIYKNCLIEILFSTQFQIYLMNVNTKTEDVNKRFEFTGDFWLSR